MNLATLCSIGWWAVCPPAHHSARFYAADLQNNKMSEQININETSCSQPANVTQVTVPTATLNQINDEPTAVPLVPANDTPTTSLPVPSRVVVPATATPFVQVGEFVASTLHSKFPEIENADSLLNEMVVMPSQLVEGVLHQGSKMVLASSSKAGKTWMLLDLAMSVATGKPWIKFPTTQGRVLFLNFEIQRAFIRSRIEALQQHKQVGCLGDLDIWNLRGHLMEFERMAAEIVRQTADRAYSLIVLDPIYKALGGADENGSGTVGSLCNQLERISHHTGAAVVFAHHFPKGNQSKKSAIDRLSGSGVFARDADSIITLTEQETEDCYAMEFTLRNFKAMPPLVVGWDFPLLKFRETLDPNKLRGKKADKCDPNELVELLGEAGLTSKEWEEMALANGWSRSSYFRIRKELLKAPAKVVQGDDKKYRTAVSAPAAATATSSPPIEASCSTPPAPPATAQPAREVAPTAAK